MKRYTLAFAVLAMAWGLSLPATQTEVSEATARPKETTPMTHTARGAFDVRLDPLPPAEGEAEFSAGRMAIDKTFHGDLEGSSVGQMLVVRTKIQNSAGYVAMERVTGKLQGRSGSFILQHSSTMNRGEPEQAITVVPDSATGELEGLSGRMTIEIKDGQHLYEFEYSLPEAP